MKDKYKIVAFYEFRDMGVASRLKQAQFELKAAMAARSILGTVIVAVEGYNGVAAGGPEAIDEWVGDAASILGARLRVRTTFADSLPFRRASVQIRREIVTLREPVEMALAVNTHIDAREWNDLIRRPDVLLLDARNDYEYRTGTFSGAVNPRVPSFGELPGYARQNIDPAVHKKVAMFCTGGIRCEKFAPWLRAYGVREVYQLKGGVLAYLQEVPAEEQMWEGDCFVFDDRIAVDRNLQPSGAVDLSQEDVTE